MAKEIYRLTKGTGISDRAAVSPVEQEVQSLGFLSIKEGGPPPPDAENWKGETEDLTRR
jgi:hypothetical protein